ncbi:extensin family protein [Paracoccus aurantiacus]|uniref:Extensin family protein n=1 Tax=Paracoccus aurantiacus TaxID=2599412 RepID=A0A5C6S5S6_9RHOB|nr:extensin family protein [Paracoccus aurantiacus]TXB69789.1 extensin family protein [Paracoccus aurantiacus]
MGLPQQRATDPVVRLVTAAFFAAFAVGSLAAGAQQVAQPLGFGAEITSPGETEAEALLGDATRPPARPVGADGPQPQRPQATPAAPADPALKTEPAAPAAVPAAPAWQQAAENIFSYRLCLLNLDMMQVRYEEVQPITSAEDRDCGIARPLRVTQLQPGVEIPGGAEMRCDTARRLALWMRNEAQPAAVLLPGSPRITALLPGSTYQCRARIGGASDRLSEHALGNAFDIAALRFSDGQEIPVEPRDDSGQLEEAFQKAIRYGACLYFTTVLGPGSNAAHDNHLHFDIAARKGGWRLCE